MKILPMLFVLLFVGCEAPILVLHERPIVDSREAAAVRAAANSVVKLAVIVPDSPFAWQGSGVCVGTRAILTAAHVSGVPGTNWKTIVSTKDGGVFGVVRATGQSGADWSLLEVPPWTAPAIECATDAEVGEKCIAIGCGLGSDPPVITEGRIYRVSGGTVEASAPIVWGNSGGGLFVWRGGALKLVGITVSIDIAKGQGVFHMATSQDISAIRRELGLD